MSIKEYVAEMIYHATNVAEHGTYCKLALALKVPPNQEFLEALEELKTWNRKEYKDLSEDRKEWFLLRADGILSRCEQAMERSAKEALRRERNIVGRQGVMIEHLKAELAEYKQAQRESECVHPLYDNGKCSACGWEVPAIGTRGERS